MNTNNETKQKPNSSKFPLKRLLCFLREFIYTLLNHRKIIRNLENEVTKDFDLKIKEMKKNVDSIDLTMESDILKMLVSHLIEIYRNIGGENYLSMTAAHKGELYVFTIRRKRGMTPAEKVKKLQAENNELRKQIGQKA